MRLRENPSCGRYRAKWYQPDSGRSMADDQPFCQQIPATIFFRYLGLGGGGRNRGQPLG